ncbi:MAG: shufflon system plasmid conjugative transfer pilus tip adhesin PilV [Pseudomonadota bacterium]
MMMQIKKREAGFGALEMMGVILVLAIVLPMLYDMWSDGVTEIKKRATAKHFIEVAEAVELYGLTYSDELLAASTATSGTVITIADLQDEQLLSEHFQELNPWGQSYLIYAREPRTDELQLIILTSGGLEHETDSPKFGNIIVPSTAALATAGFIPVDTPTNLQGAYNAWLANLTSLNIASTGAGHLGTVITPSASDLSSDFLHRVEIPNHDELNEMWTELDMTDHDIENVKTLQFTPHTIDEITDGLCVGTEQEGALFLHESDGLYICRNGAAENIADTGNSVMPREMTIAASGDIITKPTCDEATNTTPEIFLSPTLVSSGAVSSLSSIQTWATELSDTEWQIFMRVLTETGWIYPTSDYGKILVTTTCVK